MVFPTATQLGCGLIARLAIRISELIYMFGPRRYAQAWIGVWSAVFPKSNALLRQKLLIFLAVVVGLDRSAVRSAGGLDATLRQSGPIDIHCITLDKNLLFYLANYVDSARSSVFIVPERLTMPIRRLVPDAHFFVADTSPDAPADECAADASTFTVTPEMSERSTTTGLRLFVRGRPGPPLRQMIAQLSNYGCETIVDSFPLADAVDAIIPSSTEPSHANWERATHSFEEAKLRHLFCIDARVEQSVLFVETPLERFGTPNLERTRAAVLPVLQQVIDGGFPLSWKCEFENPDAPLLAGTSLDGKVEKIGIEEPTELVCEYFDVIVTFASREVALNHHSKIYLVDDLAAWHGPEPEDFRRAADGLLNAAKIRCSRLSDSPLEEHMSQWNDVRLSAAPENEKKSS